MQRVVITGAASGIGRAVAAELARRASGELRLALIDRDGAGLDEVGRELRNLGADATALVVDLATADLDAVAVGARAALGGPIDMVFNNAGVAVVKPLDRTTTEDWRWVFDVNVWAPIRLVRALAPEMVARRAGHIVMMSSVAGLVGAPGMVAYSTTKFAIAGFAEALRAELAPANVAVTVVYPGYVRTGLHRATRYANPMFERMLDGDPWWGISADRAARRIADGIARRDHEIVFGLEKLGWYVKRVSPRLGHAITAWVARRAGIVGAASPHEPPGDHDESPRRPITDSTRTR